MVVKLNNTVEYPINSNRNISYLSFDLRPKIKFTVSSPYSLAYQYKLKAKNEDINISKKIRKFLFKKLSKIHKIRINSEEDLYKIVLISQSIKDADKTYRKCFLQSLQLDEDGFSKMITKEFISKFVGKKI